MEPTDNFDLDEESTTVAKEVDSQEEPVEKVAVVEGVTTSMPATTVVTTTEMKNETVETRDTDMEMTTVIENASDEATTMMPSENS